MQDTTTSREHQASAITGYLMLLVVVGLIATAITCFVHGGSMLAAESVSKLEHPGVKFILCGVALILGQLLLWSGFFVVEPNMARVIVLFGSYRGTIRQAGFFWTNPFANKRRISLRARNLNGDKLKVNDLLGNPIEIAAVVVWLVRDTAQATFDVENYEAFVRVQSESALRAVASRHPYDDGQAHEVQTTLRGSADAVADELRQELHARLARAGVEVIETRLMHLAYAPEIAAAMLQRQQAGAIVAARQKVVEGAVGIVEMALEQMATKKMFDLDPERRATMVGNLLVVLCGHGTPTPVINTGSLYT